MVRSISDFVKICKIMHNLQKRKYCILIGSKSPLLDHPNRHIWASRLSHAPTGKTPQGKEKFARALPAFRTTRTAYKKNPPFFVRKRGVERTSRTKILAQIRRKGCAIRGIKPLNFKGASVAARQMQSSPISATGVWFRSSLATSISPGPK